VFVSGGILIFLQVGDSQSQRKIIRRTVLAAVTVLMTVEVASLVVLDRPFSPIARIQPSAMTDAIALLEAGRAGQPRRTTVVCRRTTNSYRLRPLSLTGVQHPHQMTVQTSWKSPGSSHQGR